MTLKAGDFALWTGTWRPVVVEITAVTEKMVRLKEGAHRERRGDKAHVIAYGSDRQKLDKAVEKIVSVTAEANRRRSAAGQYERDEIARIAKEAMA